jgi:crossover junction endodeoxyribonuclease RuvC
VRILGIDCGSQRTGFGVIDSDGRVHRLVAAGAITTSAKDSFPVRLSQIHTELLDLTRRHAPDAVAVEDIFHGINVKSALKLAHVRGVALLLAADAGLPVGEYSPLEVKMGVVGFGRAEKSQVQMMVKSLLGMRESVRSLDASDALAVAICHATRSLGGGCATKPRATLVRS